MKIKIVEDKINIHVLTNNKQIYIYIYINMGFNV